MYVNGKEMVKFKVKDSEIVATPLCLGKISKEWSVNIMKRTGYVYDFNVDYDPNLGDKNKAMPTFHNYFMFNYGIK